jgi:uncharacterized Zn-binding protein involved in type VI secretion
MTTEALGQEGFRWFIGVVEDREDPKKIGRLKVRAHGIHGDKVEAPTDQLPWATVMMPMVSASLKRVGISPTGIQVGSTVVGFFMDGQEGMVPIILGVLPGVDDIPLAATGQQSINKNQVGIEPTSAFNAKYPYNKVTQTESGHLIEIDDTPNNERLHTFHRSGTYEEIDKDGRRVNKIVGDDFEIVQKNQTIYIQGNVNIKVNGSYTLDVDGPVVINGSTVNINKGSNGAARLGDLVTNDDNAGNQPIAQGSSTVLIGG